MSVVVDRLALLETFVRVAETGSLSAAARAIGTTQPTVSRRLAQLETALGCKLAIRDTASFTLTDEGRSLLVDARDLGERWSGVAQRLSAGGLRPEGTLRVIGPVGYGSTFLTDVVTTLCAEHPGLRVELTLTDRAVDLVATGAEVRVVVGEGRNPDLVRRRLGSMDRVLVATPALLRRLGRVTIDRLPSLPCVGLVPYFVGTTRLFSGGEVRTIALDTPVATDSLLASYRAILNGAGIGTSAPWMCEDEVRHGRLVRVLANWQLEPVNIQVELLPGRHRPARVDAFITALLARLARLPGYRPR